MLKIWLKVCKIQESVRNIPRNDVIKDNILFLKIVNKEALSAYAKVKNGWWFILWFVKGNEMKGNEKLCKIYFKKLFLKNCAVFINLFL